MMIRHLRILIIVFFVYICCISSCKRNDEPASKPVATFKFLVNGTEVQLNGKTDGTPVCILCGPRIDNYNGEFRLMSSRAQNAGEFLILGIKSTSLGITNYGDTLTTPVESLSASHRLFLPPLNAAATEVGDYASITFTSKKNGKYFDGTFKARLTVFPGGPTAPKVEIERGEFYNVEAE